MATVVADLRRLAHAHQNDRDGGEDLLRELARWLRSENADDVRRALLVLASADDDPLWGAAVEALVRERSDTGESLETYLRALNGSTVWRDELLFALARLGRTSALDLMLAHVDMHLDDRRSRAAETLAYIGRFAPEVFLERATRYIAEGERSIAGAQLDGLAGAYLAILIDSPKVLLDLVRRVLARDDRLGRALITAMTQRLEMRPAPAGDATNVEWLRKQLNTLAG